MSFCERCLISGNENEYFQKILKNIFVTQISFSVLKKKRPFKTIAGRCRNYFITVFFFRLFFFIREIYPALVLSHVNCKTCIKFLFQF